MVTGAWTPRAEELKAAQGPDASVQPRELLQQRAKRAQKPPGAEATPPRPATLPKFRAGQQTRGGAYSQAGAEIAEGLRHTGKCSYVLQAEVIRSKGVKRTYTKIGTTQRRLARPLCKDDTQICEALHVFGGVCGHSKKQPFCDGSHFFQCTGLSPLKFKAQETCTVVLCTCKATQRPPYCNGTHRSEQVQKAEVGASL
ncbi:CDGSH iron-sulfur domain-containing protein 3, mitochondrial [Tupaia chinensis]|uniref:CDGSH iron-sulfur domain-containing protein 3, mitochondrial n=1 Tax=Tupaia chinensis TaxID=246437 RepID=L9KS12_TUPCH|nr:CDGSH iron-sulfur domain-containing protein 3, mitochondrial [Tupaia chinensis]